MKMKSVFRTVLFLALAMASVSCFDKWGQEPAETFFATVTVKPSSTGGYLHRGDSVALYATNASFTSGSEWRAVASYVLDEKFTNIKPIDGHKQTLAVKLNGLDTLRLRTIELYDAAKESEYGVDRVAPYVGPVFPSTGIEDGYLNLAFVMPVTLGNSLHTVRLIRGVNPEKPYELWLRHNAKGDIAGSMDYIYLYGYSLKDIPASDDNKLVIKWVYEGQECSLELDYTPRTNF